MYSHEFIFDSDLPFENRCKQVFSYQAEKSGVFKSFIRSFGLTENSDIEVDNIPLLPIEAFKYKPIIIDELSARLRFKSSGTGNMRRSIHYVHNAEIYKKSISKEFYRHFPQSQYSILFYLPGYAKNKDSSLIWMANYLIQKDASGLSRFISETEGEIVDHLKKIEAEGRKVVLFGAAFGILDLIDSNWLPTPKSLEVIETGGMKTYRREMSKRELRGKISEAFEIPINHIHSEYGMCELLSQSYAIGNEWFKAPHWVRITVRKEDDPGIICEPGEEGKIGIIDLANLHSCSFILTEDRGVMKENGLFQVLGRWNPENPRGCNFLIDS